MFVYFSVLSVCHPLPSSLSIYLILSVSDCLSVCLSISHYLSIPPRPLSPFSLYPSLFPSMSLSLSLCHLRHLPRSVGRPVGRSEAQRFRSTYTNTRLYEQYSFCYPEMLSCVCKRSQSIVGIKDIRVTKGEDDKIR